MKKVFFWVTGLALFLIASPLWAFTFQPFTTEHGLRIWLMPQENAKSIRIVVHIPVGGTMDPKGKDGLAHFVEHMLFTDNDGRDELEFFKELEGYGGKANGYTKSYETVYTVAAPSSKALLAIDWIRRVIFNHEFKAEAVEKERKIVLLESDLTPPELSDYVSRLYDWLDIFEKPGLWEEEFGFTFDDRDLGGTYGSVMKIDLDDIQAFYEKHYRLNGITIFVVGGFGAEQVKDKIQREFMYSAKFNHLNQGKSPWEDSPKLKTKNKYKQEVEFINAGSLGFETKFLVDNPSQKDALTLFFLSDFLGEYLNDELRFKERSTYGVWTYAGFFKNAAYFQISGDFAKENLAKSRKTIEATLEKLKDGSFEAKEFEEYKKRAKASMDLRTNSPELMASRFQDYYFNSFIFEGFPNADEFYENIRFEEVRDFCQKWFVPNRQIVNLTYLAPLSKTAEQVINVVFLLMVFQILRKIWIQRVNLKELHYLRKFRVPILQLVLVWACLITLYIFYQRAIRFCMDHIDDLYASFEIFWIQFTLNLFLLGVWFYLSALPFSYYPRKILLFTDYLLIKFGTFRSWKIPWKNVQKAELHRFSTLFEFRKYGFTWPIGFGIFKPAVYLKAKGYPAFLFNTRNNREFLEKLEELKSRSKQKMNGRKSM